MKLEIHVLCRDEAEIFLYSARHYTAIADRVILHDMGSTDGTLDIAAKFGIGVCHWDSGNAVDDRVNMKIKSEAWMGTDADWCCMVDADEFIYFPGGVQETLAAYEAQRLPVAKPYGWEMFSDSMPSTEGQIYDEIKMGARDDIWYSKPVLFNTRLVEAIEFAPGAHACQAWLKDASLFPNPNAHSNPPVLLLHCHQIGGLERIAKKYDRTRARMCQNNVAMNWGNVHDSGAVHAAAKRAFILSKIEKVI